MWGIRTSGLGAWAGNRPGYPTQVFLRRELSFCFLSKGKAVMGQSLELTFQGGRLKVGGRDLPGASARRRPCAKAHLAI